MLAALTRSELGVQIGIAIMEALQKLLRSPSALSRARSSLAYLPDMSRDSLRGFEHLGLLATLLQSFHYFGGMRSAPSKRMTSPFSIGFS